MFSGFDFGFMLRDLCGFGASDFLRRACLCCLASYSDHQDSCRHCDYHGRCYYYEDDHDSHVLSDVFHFVIIAIRYDCLLPRRHRHHHRDDLCHYASDLPSRGFCQSSSHYVSSLNPKTLNPQTPKKP